MPQRGATRAAEAQSSSRNPFCASFSRSAARARQAAAHGAHRHRQQGGRVLVRDFVDAHHQQDVAHVLREFFQRLLQQGQGLVLFRHAVRRQIVSGMVGQHAVADEVVAPLRRAREVVAHQVERDAVQPGGQLRFAAEAAVRTGRFDEGLLGQVFGLAAVADVLDDEALQPGGVFPHQVTQQVFLARVPSLPFAVRANGRQIRFRGSGCAIARIGHGLGKETCIKLQVTTGMARIIAAYLCHNISKIEILRQK